MADEKAHGEQNRQDTKQDQDQNQSQKQNPPPAQPRRALDAFSRLPSAGLTFLAFNTAVAVYRARDNPWLVAFVVLSFLDLLLLFYCLHLHETALRNSPRRRHLGTAVWFLASFFTVMFSHEEARDNPWLAAFVVLSFFDLLLLFYCLYLLVAAPPPNSNSNSPRRRRRLRTAVWVLASFITVSFSYGEADMMLAVVWFAAALALGLGFYWFSSSFYTPEI